MLHVCRAAERDRALHRSLWDRAARNEERIVREHCAVRGAHLARVGVDGLHRPEGEKGARPPENATEVVPSQVSGRERRRHCKRPIEELRLGRDDLDDDTGSCKSLESERRLEGGNAAPDDDDAHLLVSHTGPGTIRALTAR